MCRKLAVPPARITKAYSTAHVRMRVCVYVCGICVFLQFAFLPRQPVRAAERSGGSAMIRISSFSLPLVSAELSPYELHRKPHEMVTDSTVVAVSPRALRSELMCPICLDLMKNPLTTKEVRSPAITTSMLVFYSQYLHCIAS